MNRHLRPFRILLTLALSGFICLSNLGPIQPLPAQAQAVPHLEGLSGWVNMGSLRPISSLRSGDLETVNSEANPLTVSVMDLNQDAIQDVVVGFSTGSADRLAVYFGEDPGFKNFSDAVFRPEPEITEIPAAPDFLVSGDFNGDGNVDLAFASHGSTELWFLAGDGQGGLWDHQKIDLPGAITHLKAGEINRQDGLADLALILEATQNFQVLVLSGEQGAQFSSPNLYALPEPAVDLAFGQLDADFPYDLAIAAGNNLAVLRGLDQTTSPTDDSHPTRAELDIYTQDTALVSLSIGNFLDPTTETQEIALLGADGSLKLVDGFGTELQSFLPASKFESSSTVITRLKSSSIPGDDLLLLDQASGEASIIHPGTNFTDAVNHLATVDTLVLADLNFSPSAVAVQPALLNKDALLDLVVVSAGQSSPQVILTEPAHTYYVNSQADRPDKSPGNGECNIYESNPWLTVCSLRAAIEEANAAEGADEIQVFNNVFIGSQLPTITESVTIIGENDSGPIGVDGTNAGYVDGFRITSGTTTIWNIGINHFKGRGVYITSGGGNIIDNSQVGPGNLSDGIVIESNYNQVTDSVITGNGYDGINLTGTNNTVQRNLIGLWKTATLEPSNKNDGIRIGGNNNYVGGSVANRNTISGNTRNGVYVKSGAQGSLIQSNYIGLDPAGTTDAGTNYRWGVVIYTASNVTVGGSINAYANYISNNTSGGIYVYGPNASGNIIRRNNLGMTPSGSIDYNNGSGIEVKTTNHAVQIVENVVGGYANGIFVYAPDPASPGCITHGIRDNTIGTNSAQTADWGNRSYGILVQDVGCAIIDGNFATNNGSAGIYLVGDTDMLAEVTNNHATGNVGNGLEINSDSNQVENNSASYNGYTGLLIDGSSNSLSGNSIFENGSAGISIGGDNNTLIGSGSLDSYIVGNDYEGVVISGGYNTVSYYIIESNGYAGVLIYGDHNDLGLSNFINGNGYGVYVESGASYNWIHGNSIGVDTSGNVGAGNALVNVYIKGTNTLLGGNSTANANVISNAPVGVELVGNDITANTIQGNKIGTNAAGTADLGNQVGIKISGSVQENPISQNLIAYNGIGVLMEAGRNNLLSQNQIHSNSGMGIDLAPQGVTANDTGDEDNGANSLLNYPTLNAAELAPGGTRIQGSLNSVPLYQNTLQFFSSDSCDGSGYGEGQTYIGELAVATNADGNGSIDVTLSADDTLGKYITATNSIPNFGTSEFSKCIQVTLPENTTPFIVNTLSDAPDINVADLICDSNAAAGEQCTLRAAVMQANATPGANTITLPVGTLPLTIAEVAGDQANTGDLDISDAVTLIGAGANLTIIDSTTANRVFEIRNNADVILRGITVSGGDSSFQNGGGILIGTGSSLSLDAVNVTGNTTSAFGGGVFNDGSLTTKNTSFINNYSVSGGGGLYQDDGDSMLINSTFSGNSSAGNGGGIARGNGSVSLSNVTVTLNQADTNNTGDNGGGLYNAGGTFLVRNSLIAGNTDVSHGTTPYGHPDCSGTFTSGEYNLIGDSGNSTGCLGFSGTTHDSVGGFYLMSNYLTWGSGLGPLQLNGGTTPNHSPIGTASGLVVDLGNPAQPGSSVEACGPFDQRGQPRPIDGGTDGVARCDRGAVEHIPARLSINDITAAEGSNAVFQVTLSEPAQIAFTVDYATSDDSAIAGSDYQQSSGQIAFAVGETSKSVSVPVLNDTLNEPEETFKVTLSNQTYVFIADGEGIATIEDGDAVPAILINNTSVSEGNPPGQSQLSFTVTLNSPSGKTVTVNYATSDNNALAGEDYHSTQGTITFSPGVTSRQIVVEVIGDMEDEANETMTVTLSNPVNATMGDGSGTGTINDDDSTAFSIQNTAGFENNSGTTTFYFTVRLSASSVSTKSVTYSTAAGTAQAGSDFISTSGTLTFAPGETVKTILVTINGDELVEDNETFTVQLSNPTGGATIAAGTATGTILDDDLVTYSTYLPMMTRQQ